VTTDMYADRANGGQNPKKRSIRDRLGGNVEQLAIGRQPNTKRVREDNGKWKHDLYEDKVEADVQGICILQSHLPDHSNNCCQCITNCYASLKNCDSFHLGLHAYLWSWQVK
jgi:hypothetical protein